MIQKITLLLATLMLAACHSSPSSSGVDSQLAQVQQMVFAETNGNGGGNAAFVCVGRLNEQSGTFLAASLTGNHGQGLQLKVERVRLDANNHLDRRPLQDSSVYEVRGASYVSYFSGGGPIDAENDGRLESRERHQRHQDHGHGAGGEHFQHSAGSGSSLAEYDESNRELRLHLNDGRSRNTVIRCDTGEILSMN